MISSWSRDKKVATNIYSKRGVVANINSKKVTTKDFKISIVLETKVKPSDILVDVDL